MRLFIWQGRAALSSPFCNYFNYSCEEGGVSAAVSGIIIYSHVTVASSQSSSHLNLR